MESTECLIWLLTSLAETARSGSFNMILGAIDCHWSKVIVKEGSMMVLTEKLVVCVFTVWFGYGLCWH